MKSGGLFWTAFLLTMLWLAIAADGYYLSEKEVSVFLPDSVTLYLRQLFEYFVPLTCQTVKFIIYSAHGKTVNSEIPDQNINSSTVHYYI